MHFTQQLEKVEQRDKHISKHFLGVFAADQIPLGKTGCCIVNTDPISKTRQHWVCVFTGGDGKKNFYFDSYGLPPTHWNSHWAPFMSYIRSNGDFQQETSDVCGDYRVYVLKKLCSMPTPDLQEVVKYFDEDDKKGNDVLVFDLIHKEFPRILNDTDHELNVDYDNFKKNIKSRQQGSKPRRVLQLLD